MEIKELSTEFGDGMSNDGRVNSNDEPPHKECPSTSAVVESTSMVLPGVVGFMSSGKLQDGATATDLALTVTHMLRKHDVFGKSVEFYAWDMGQLSVAGSTIMGFLPVETESVIESYLHANKMFVDYNEHQHERVYSSYLDLDLSEIESCISGPKRLHDRALPKEVKADWNAYLNNNIGFKDKMVSLSFNGWPAQLGHGNVVTSVIINCTNTSNPSVMLGAGFVTMKACEFGLEVKLCIKASVAPGYRVVTKHLLKCDLQKYLNQHGFDTVDFGCTACIGNSEDLDESVSAETLENDIVAASVFSGNQNPERRVYPLARANYLASPPLVVAYLLAETFEADQITLHRDGDQVHPLLSLLTTSSLDQVERECDNFGGLIHGVDDAAEDTSGLVIPDNESVVGQAGRELADGSIMGGEPDGGHQAFIPVYLGNNPPRYLGSVAYHHCTLFQSHEELEEYIREQMMTWGDSSLAALANSLNIMHYQYRVRVVLDEDEYYLNLPTNYRSLLPLITRVLFGGSIMGGEPDGDHQAFIPVYVGDDDPPRYLGSVAYHHCTLFQSHEALEEYIREQMATWGDSSLAALAHFLNIMHYQYRIRKVPDKPEYDLNLPTNYRSLLPLITRVLIEFA